jgi:hypothetical protein
MISKTTRKRSAHREETMFGACEPESSMLILVLEACNLREAKSRVTAVAPLLGVKVGIKLLLVPLKEIPSGVPVFLRTFFCGGGIGFGREDVGPSSSTFH